MNNDYARQRRKVRMLMLRAARALTQQQQRARARKKYGHAPCYRFIIYNNASGVGGTQAACSAHSTGRD